MFCVLSGPLILKVVGPQVSVWNAASLLRHKSPIPTDVQLMSIAQPLRLRWGIIDTWWWYYLLPALDRKLFIYQVNRSHQIIQQQPATVTEDWGRQFFIDYILFIGASQQEAATLYTSPLQYRRRYKIDINDVISFSLFDHEKWSQMQIILRIQNGRFMSSVN